MITVKSLGLTDANLVIQAGIARANKIGSPSTIAVVDVGGTVVAQARMDGASLSSVALAYDKAYTSLSCRLPTSTITKIARIDAVSPKFYSMCSGGSGFKRVGLGMRKSAGGATTGVSYLVTLTDVTVTSITHNSNGTDVIVLSFGEMTSNVPASVALSMASATAMIR